MGRTKVRRQLLCKGCVDWREVWTRSSIHNEDHRHCVMEGQRRRSRGRSMGRRSKGRSRGKKRRGETGGGQGEKQGEEGEQEAREKEEGEQGEKQCSFRMY